MEREPRTMEPLKDRQKVKESDPLSSLKVTNEVNISPVEAANKSGCGRCG